MACDSGSIKPIGEFSEITEINNARNLSKAIGNQIDVYFTKVQQIPTYSNSGKIQRSSRNNSSVGSGNSPSCLQNLSYYFSQYCRVAGIHGVQYIGERGRYTIEKLIWAVVLTILCSLCSYLISQTYNRWVTSPVVVTFATTEVPIWKIPFPAVTICPEVKSNPEIFNFTDILLRKVAELNISPEQDRYFENFRTVCSDEFYISATKDNGSLVIDQSNLLTDLSMALPAFNPLTAYWLGKEVKWNNEFSLSLTSSGYCYSFNMLRVDEMFKNIKFTDINKNNPKVRKWSLESGYPNDDSDSFPRKTFLSGMDGGLRIEALFANHSHLDHLCTRFMQGFKVVLHHPWEIPNMDKHFRIPLDKVVFVGITPRMTTVSEELKSYRPEDRKCYLAGERPLILFKSYTQQNCIHECLYNYTLLKCGCVPFYIPHAHEDIATCGAGSRECVEESKIKYLLKEDNNCNCLPFCTTLEYNVEVTQSDWNWREFFEMVKHLGFSEILVDDENSHFSNLVVFYKDLQTLPSVRHELYGCVDFLSSVGGLLGLFIGFSVTTLIEIIYFLSLRLVCNIKKFGRKCWSGEPELINDGNDNLSQRKNS